MDDIRTRLRRYTAGIYNTINQNLELADSDNATKAVEVTRIFQIDDLNPQKARQTVQVEVVCEEDYA